MIWSVIEKKECCGCGVCVNICPVECLELRENSEGFLYPEYNQRKCIQCKKCLKVCPAYGNVEGSNGRFLMAWHKDKDVLLKSSSGGVFTALACYVLQKGGVVAGAAMDIKTKRISHIIVDNEEDLEQLRLSKYYQSDMNNIYKKVEEFLENGKIVLFTGTACQIAGMKNYVKDKKCGRYLITVDVLCHGVESKKALDAYNQSKEREFKKEIINYQFRVKDRRIGWSGGGGTRMKLDFSDGSSFITDSLTDTFYVGYNYNIFLRESCYQCRFSGTKRVADFTIADFWGVTDERLRRGCSKPLSKEEADEQRRLGISLMMVNTDKAENILSELGEVIEMSEINPEEAIRWNHVLNKPYSRPEARDYAYQWLESKPHDKVVKKILRIHYIKIHMRKILGDRLTEKIKKIARLFN